MLAGDPREGGSGQQYHSTEQVSVTCILFLFKINVTFTTFFTCLRTSGLQGVNSLEVGAEVLQKKFQTGIHPLLLH